MVLVIWLGKTALVTCAGVGPLGHLLLQLKAAMARLFQPLLWLWFLRHRHLHQPLSQKRLLLWLWFQRSLQPK